MNCSTCDDETCTPLSILLSMYGSRTSSKLLFRYPYMGKLRQNTCCIPQNNSTSSGFKDLINCGFADADPDEGTRDEVEQLLAFSDETIAHILCPGNMDLSEQHFDVKINGLRFVGFILNLANPGQSKMKPSYSKNDSTDQIPIMSFNVSFVLKTTANYSMAKMYIQLAAKIGRSLRVEEIRSQYLSEQVREMHNIHDDESLNADQIHQQILSRCSLANSLQECFDMLCDTGVVEVFINNNMRVSFCLYHKVHLSANTPFGQLTVKEEEIKKTLNSIQPYHGLLIYDLQDITNSLNASCSTSIILVLNACKPTKSFQSISTDVHTPINHVYAIARHLVAWGKACIIYPLCESNVYMLAPNADLGQAMAWSVEFYKKFGVTLTSMLSSFSLPICLGDLCSPRAPFFDNQKQLIEIVFWMLRHRILMQHHTYINFIPPVSNGELNLADVNAAFHELAGKNLEQVSLLPELCKKVLQPISDNLSDEDSGMFLKVFKYLNGRHHLEDIMYQENMKRSQLLTVLDKFKSVLVTTSREDLVIFSS